MPLYLPTPKEAKDTYLDFPVVRYLLSLSTVPKKNRCVFKDIWFHLLLGTFSVKDFDIRSSILWGKGLPEGVLSRFWVLSVLKRVQVAGTVWPNALLVIGYRQVPRLIIGSTPDFDDNNVRVDDVEVSPDSTIWYGIFEMLKRHLSSIKHVNTSIPKFIAVTVGRYIRFVTMDTVNGTLRLIPLEGDPVFDIACQHHAVQQVLDYIREGRETFMYSTPSTGKGFVYG